MVIIWISRSGCDTQIGHCVSQSMNRESRPQPIEEMTESFKAPYSLLWGRMESPNMALEQAFPTEHWSGWWLGTFFIFPYIGNNHLNWLISFRFFQRGWNHQPETFILLLLQGTVIYRFSKMLIAPAGERSKKVSTAASAPLRATSGHLLEVHEQATGLGPRRRYITGGKCRNVA